MNRIVYRCLCWFGAIMLASAAALAQAAPLRMALGEPLLESVGDSSSIPDGIIVSMVQDRHGLIWIGTQAGLIRYDGYRFRRFMHQPQQANSLAGNYITTLAIGADGRIWIGTFSDGVSVYDPASGQFTGYRHQPGQAGSIRAGKIWALAGEPDGGMWLATDTGLDYLAAGSTTVEHWSVGEGSGLRICSLLLDRQRRLWLGSAQGLYRLDRERRRFDAVASMEGNATSLAGQELHALFEAQDGKLWLGTRERGAAWLEPKTERLHWVPSPAPATPGPGTGGKPLPLFAGLGYIKTIGQPQSDQIWLGSYGAGVRIVSARDGQALQHLRHDVARSHSLANDRIGSFLQDQSGLFWIGTWGGGLQRFHPRNHGIRILQHSPAFAAGLSHADVRSVAEAPDGRLLVGTSGNGIDIIDRQRGRIGGYRPNPDQPGVLGDGIVTALLTTPDGKLWAGTQQAGVQVLSPGSSRWQTVSLLHGLPAIKVNRLWLGPDARVWAATSGGVARWHDELQRFVALRAEPGEPMTAGVYGFAAGADGRVWLASATGVWLLEPGAQALRQIRHDPGRADSLASDDTYAIMVDARNQLWVINALGLDRLLSYDGKLARFEHVGERFGRAAQDLGGNLQLDSGGRIWTEKNVYDPVLQQLLDLSEADGYHIGTGWTGADGRTRDGLLLFGGTRGLALIDPSQFTRWDYVPPLVALGWQVDGKARPGLATALSLVGGERSFSLEFAALDYSAPDKIRYRYRLHGYDDDWTEVDAERRLASYGNLAPGQYRLQVRASNRTGQWRGPVLDLPVTVAPRFWQTLPFRLAAGLAGLALAFWLHRWRLRLLRAKAGQLQALVDLRTSDIIRAHTSLAQANRDLLETRQQMVHQEKLAALGQLVTSVAHEVNTPISAIQSSGSIIMDALLPILDALPTLLERLSATERELFMKLVAHLKQPVAVPSSRAERALVRQTENQLQQAGIDNAPNLAAVLVQLQVSHDWQPFMPLLCHPQSREIIALAHQLAQVMGNARNINQAVGRVSKIVFALKAFAHMDSSGDRVPIQLQENLETVLTIYQGHIRQRAELVREFAELPPLAAYPGELSQVWVNLILNALQAMTQHGVLTLTIRREAEWAVVSVTDTGCGMPAAVAARIFEPFFTTRAAGEGSGLGLDIAKKIVEKHHGRIEFATEVGVGSTFSVYLPLS